MAQRKGAWTINKDYKSQNGTTTKNYCLRLFKDNDSVGVCSEIVVLDSPDV